MPPLPQAPPRRVAGLLYFFYHSVTVVPHLNIVSLSKVCLHIMVLSRVLTSFPRHSILTTPILSLEDGNT
jgi:hypothetical protein